MAVVGMGGYFCRAKNPKGLKAWFRQHPGVGGGIGADPVNGHSNEWGWYHQGGPMVSSPFKADTDCFAADKQAMIHLRVRDLDGLLTGLRESGITISEEEEQEGVGRFTRLFDPEDNPVELWEPAAAGGVA